MAAQTNVNLRERAIAAHLKEEAEADAAAAIRELEERSGQARRLKAALRECLGVAAEPTSGTIEIDGLILSLHTHYLGDSLDLMGRCPDCGELLIWTNVSRLTDLGRALSHGFVPDYDHLGGCQRYQERLRREQPESPTPSAAEQLIDLIGEGLRTRGWIGGGE